MSNTRPTPTGASHDVGPEEMFFSTTDAKGIIKETNTVFVHLSRYGREHLVGAPHNIIRHPDMPAGAFLLMWQTLEAGQPFCAYVDNLAADGSRYTVFAAITPLGDDYLSVRVRPQRLELLDAARSLYATVRPEELAAREAGASAHDAAVLGLGRLAELLAEAGFPNYDEFVWTALPAEVRERSASRGGYPTRPGASGPMGELLTTAGRLHEELAAWVAELDGFAELADTLVAGGVRLGESVAASEAAASDFSEVVMAQGAFSPVLGSITLWAGMVGEVGAMLTGLASRLTELRTSVLQTRFRIALAALQSESVGQFACELIDEVPGSDAARPAIHALVRALREGVSDAAAAMDANAALAAQVADEVHSLAELMGVPTSLLSGFQSLAVGRSDEAVDALLPRVAEVIERSQADADALVALAERCRGVRPLHTEQVFAELDAIDRLALEGS